MMKAKHVLLMFTCLCVLWANAQRSKIYYARTHVADSLFKAGQYFESARIYNAVFAASRGEGDVWDRYMAARCWALSGFGDSALFHLERLIYQDRYCPMHIMRDDPAFVSLKKNRNYINVIDTASAINEVFVARREKLKTLFEPQLAAGLDSIQKTDQYWRQQIDDTEKRFGRLSDEMKDLWRKIEYQDSINLVKVKLILDTRGWLGPEIVRRGSGTMFLVIQHSDLKTQLQYLPMVREAVAKGKLDRGSLAMLEDRVLLRQNKKQVYGTQIGTDSITGKKFVSPLIDPDNVDKRREEIGMGSLADYISNWDLTWDVESYKKEIAEREKQFSK